MWQWLTRLFTKKAIAKAPPPPEAPKSLEPKWIEIARRELGQSELKKGDNPRILEYHRSTLLKAKKDEVSWCSAFVCWCLETSGIRSTRSAAARSYLNFGVIVSLADAKLGDIAVFKRGAHPWQGHVAFFISQDEKYLTVLGGNQSDAVTFAKFEKSALLGIRRVLVL